LNPMGAYAVHCPDRAALVDALGPRTKLHLPPEEIPRSDFLSIAARTDDAWMLWSRDPRRSRAMPEVIIVGDGMGRETMAWLSTYAPSLRPFSSWFRVYETAEFARDVLGRSEESFDGLGHGFAAILIGELLATRGRTTGSASDGVTVSACKSTLSWAILRDGVVRSHSIADIPDLWRRLRSRTEQRERRELTANVSSACAVLLRLARGNVEPLTGTDEIDDTIFGICRAIRRSEDPPPFRPQLRTALADRARAIEGPRERRLLMVEELVHSVAWSGPSVKKWDAFLIAYAVSCVQPGSMAHASLLEPLLPLAPDAVLWLALCAGLRPDSTVGFEYGSVGLRALRDLFAVEDLLCRPRADISFAELDILSGEKIGPVEFPRSSSTNLVVELAPSVETTIVWPSRSRTSSADSVQLPLLTTQSSDHINASDWRDIQRARDVLTELLKKRTASDELNPDKRSSTSDLESSGSGKKGRRR
jgi:hypothetical protein